VCVWLFRLSGEKGGQNKFDPASPSSFIWFAAYRALVENGIRINMPRLPKRLGHRGPVGVDYAAVVSIISSFLPDKRHRPATVPSNPSGATRAGWCVPSRADAAAAEQKMTQRYWKASTENYGRQVQKGFDFAFLKDYFR
jgi:hypothetical protein